MNTLLIYFAFPIAVIIFSIVLQKLLNSPITVASIVFAVFIVVTFAAFDESFLIETLVYTIISLITALIVSLLKNKTPENNLCDILSNYLQNNISNNSIGNYEENLIGTESNNNSSCGCNRYRRR